MKSLKPGLVGTGGAGAGSSPPPPRRGDGLTGAVLMTDTSTRCGESWQKITGGAAAAAGGGRGGRSAIGAGGGTGGEGALGGGCCGRTGRASAAAHRRGGVPLPAPRARPPRCWSWSREVTATSSSRRP